MDPLAATKILKYPDHDYDAMASTFRLLGTGVTLTQADKAILMEPQHMPPAEKQGKGRVLRVTQERYVKIVRLVCDAIAIEEVIVNTSKLRQYFATVAMKARSGEGEAEGNGDSRMVDV